MDKTKLDFDEEYTPKPYQPRCYLCLCRLQRGFFKKLNCYVYVCPVCQKIRLIEKADWQIVKYDPDRMG